MNKNLLKIIALSLVLVLVSLVNMPASLAKEPVQLNEAVVSENVVTVADKSSSTFDVNEVYKTRFLNMLNHNYVYGESFKFVEDMINDSMPALLKYRDAEDDSYIAEQFVSDYMFDMYGIDFIDYSEVNSQFGQVEGYVYIIPRGFSVYEHKISSVTCNEDGSFTVKSRVTISSHDSADFVDDCETLFVRNELSPFGFSIIRSVIGSKALLA